LIDEIDVHLHPRWQRAIVPALEDLFPSCQFIGTTHSPFVIQAVDRSKILYADQHRRVSLEEGSNSIEDIAEEIQEIYMPQRGVRAERLSNTAERYFRLLKQENVPAGELEEAEKEYRLASEPFSSNPAVHALLKVEVLEAGNR
jgi:predicted ATP-binding protein involved in virulence